MSSLKNIFGGVAWSLIFNVTNAVYGFFSVPLLLNYFGKEQYGLIGIALSVNLYLRILDMGFSSGNVKFFSSYLAKNDYEGLNKLFQSSLLFYLVIAAINALVLLVLGIYPEYIFHFSANDTVVFRELMYILIITSFPVWGGNVMEQLLRSNDLVAWQQRILLLTKVAQLLVLFATIYLQMSLVSFFLFNTLCSVINIPFYVGRIKKLQIGISFIPQYHKKAMAEVLPYCLSVFSFGIFQFSANYLRPVFLGIKLGVTSVSDFRVIEGIANMVLILGSSFVGVILPHAAKVRETGDKVKEMQIALDGTRYISIFLGLIIFGFTLSSKELLILYVGEKNAYLVPWLNLWIFSLLGLHNSALSSLVLVSNSLRPIVYISAFSTFFSLTLAWFFMDIFGMGGVIIAYTCYVISQLSYYYFYYYPKKLHYNSWTIFKGSFLLPTLVIGTVGIVIKWLFSLLDITNKFALICLKEVVFGAVALVLSYFLLLRVAERAYIQEYLEKLMLKVKKR